MTKRPLRSAVHVEQGNRSVIVKTRARHSEPACLSRGHISFERSLCRGVATSMGVLGNVSPAGRMEITTRSKRSEKQRNYLVQNQDKMGFTHSPSVNTKGIQSESTIVAFCQSLMNSVNRQRDGRRTIACVLRDGIMCPFKVAKTNRVVQVLIGFVLLVWLLLHIYCLPATCDDPFFIPRTSKQFSLDYPYVHSAEKLCFEHRDGRDVAANIDMVILVLTMSQRVAERQAIRSTYGSVSRGSTWPTTERHGQDERLPDLGAVRVVFLMGQNKDKQLQAKEAQLVAEESKVYGDMVQWDGLLEDYSNLTLKVLLGLRWVKDRCQHANHVAKTDDDIFLHIPRILTHIQGSNRNSNLIHGMAASCHKTGRKGKYSTSYEAYPLDSRPVHVKGALYIMGTQLALHLVSVAPYIPMDTMEDVFVTGTLACVAGARHKLLTPMQYDGCGPIKEPCAFADGHRVAAITKDVTIFQDIWRTFSQTDLCYGIFNLSGRVRAFFRLRACLI